MLTSVECFKWWQILSTQFQKPNAFHWWIGKQLGIAHSTVSHVLKTFKDRQISKWNDGSGTKRGTSDPKKARIVMKFQFVLCKKKTGTFWTTRLRCLEGTKAERWGLAVPESVRKRIYRNSLSSKRSADMAKWVSSSSHLEPSTDKFTSTNVSKSDFCFGRILDHYEGKAS